ncbi:cholesterol oxidase [Jatrophihabitans sp. GAS493]|uniref:GMC oxidoreductase n=1 Tax=Jatrophihabitans sp. GAS493 TaxID=1907575 RepID=UPI000BB6C0A7|nr:GMC oxidoreductase [Jatrophihabitans sp. GAS493]SOD72255.1 cholesterol oxidase [Jatrophihabitans sp. GAS493]
MSAINRRSFLLGAAGVTGAAVAGSASAAGALGGTSSPKTATIPVTRESHRVVVIGSGFGGGVTSLRLAQAGVPVTVLERGIRWPTGPNSSTFPNAAHLDKRALWYRSAPLLFGKPLLVDPYVGLLETVPAPNMNVVCAAGVGGGSLVYQGMTLQPSEAVFNTVLPAALDYATMNRVHYPRVAQMLQVAEAPDSLIASKTYLPSRVFARNVNNAGYALSKIPMPIDWSYAQRELTGEFLPSYTNGDCAIGVNNGGKHSVDVTYLKQAEATGLVTVMTQHEVTDIARANDDQWTVYVNRIDTAGAVLETKIITTKALVLAAGTMNTTKLLVRAKAKGSISNLPDGVGTGWGNNGDRIYVWTSLTDDFTAVQGGPVIYGSKDWGDPATANTVIQASLPPFGADIRSTMMVGFGVSSARGKFVYNSSTDDTTLNWAKDADSVLQKKISARVKKIAGPFGLLTDTNAILPSTWHPLGGAPMGSVCDLEGRVLEQKGLYVLDGALIPGNTGACNPSMTIAAVAERALDHLVATDVGSVI